MRILIGTTLMWIRILISTTVMRIANFNNRQTKTSPTEHLLVIFPLWLGLGERKNNSKACMPPNKRRLASPIRPLNAELSHQEGDPLFSVRIE